MDREYIQRCLNLGYERLDEMKVAMKQMDTCKALLTIHKENILGKVNQMLNNLVQQFLEVQQSIERTVATIIKEREEWLDYRKKKIIESNSYLVQVCIYAEGLLKGRSEDLRRSYKKILSDFEHVWKQLDHFQYDDLESIVFLEFHDNLPQFMTSTHIGKLQQFDKFNDTIDELEFWIDLPYTDSDMRNHIQSVDLKDQLTTNSSISSDTSQSLNISDSPLSAVHEIPLPKDPILPEVHISDKQSKLLHIHEHSSIHEIPVRELPLPKKPIALKNQNYNRQHKSVVRIRELDLSVQEQADFNKNDTRFHGIKCSLPPPPGFAPLPELLTEESLENHVTKRSHRNKETVNHNIISIRRGSASDSSLFTSLESSVLCKLDQDPHARVKIQSRGKFQSIDNPNYAFNAALNEKNANVDAEFPNSLFPSSDVNRQSPLPKTVICAGLTSEFIQNQRRPSCPLGVFDFDSENKDDFVWGSEEDINLGLEEKDCINNQMTPTECPSKMKKSDASASAPVSPSSKNIALKAFLHSSAQTSKSVKSSTCLTASIGKNTRPALDDQAHTTTPDITIVMGRHKHDPDLALKEEKAEEPSKEDVHSSEYLSYLTKKPVREKNEGNLESVDLVLTEKNAEEPFMENVQSSKTLSHVTKKYIKEIKEEILESVAPYGALSMKLAAECVTDTSMQKKEDNRKQRQLKSIVTVLKEEQTTEFSVVNKLSIQVGQDGSESTETLSPLSLSLPYQEKILDISSMLQHIGGNLFEVPAKCVEKIRGDLSFPIGVCTNSQGKVIVADTRNNIIKIFHNGKVIHSFGRKLTRPSAVVVNEADEIFVKDDLCIRHFSPDGQLIKMLGHRKMHNPYGLAITREGHLVVLDTLWQKPRLLIFDQNGVLEDHIYEPLCLPPLMSKCRFLAVHDKKVLTSDLGASCLYLTNLNGEFLKTLGWPGTHPGEFCEPSGIAVDSCGNWIVADSKNNRIQVFAPNGYYMCKLQLSESIRRPSGIHLSQEGLLYVINYLDNIIKVFKIGAE